jgi:hypothetical protein
VNVADDSVSRSRRLDPGRGYDLDTLSDDLARVMGELDLPVAFVEDHAAVLAA